MPLRRDRALGWVTLALALVIAVPATPAGALTAGAAARAAAADGPPRRLPATAAAQDPACDKPTGRALRPQAVPGRLYPHQGISPLATRVMHDADSVPMVRAAAAASLLASGLTFDALRRLDSWVATHDPVCAGWSATAGCGSSPASAATPSGALPDGPAPHARPGSALAQGTALALSAAAPAVRARGGPDFARGLFHARGRPRQDRAVGQLDRPQPVPMVHPGGKRDKVLNTHLCVEIALRDLAGEPSDAPAACCRAPSPCATVPPLSQPGFPGLYALRDRARPGASTTAFPWPEARGRGEWLRR
jgi:hypothetical protein